MDAESKPPLVFSDQVIRRLVTNQYSDDTMVLPKDYQVIRLVFRKMGGSWEAITLGDSEQIRLLGKVIGAWGKLREKQRKIEVV